MHRREFLQNAFGFLQGAAALQAASARPIKAQTRWRTFEITTHVEVLQPYGVTRVWVPEALIISTPFQQPLGTQWRCPTGSVRQIRRAPDGTGMIVAEFPSGVKPVLTVVSRAKLRDWSVPLSTAERVQQLSPVQREHFLRPTKFVPTDGIVRRKADEITRNASTDLDKARAIYEWIVENTYRDPSIRGGGRGDIRFMLESGDLGGKCADLNALFVGLARAAGLPARDVYGIRVAASESGLRSLGTVSPSVTRSQHCRAEVFLEERGWVPVDPADVRKVILEQPGISDRMVQRVRTRLFGSWEMNWMAYNFAQDVELPGSSGPALHFFMYPQAETANGRIDCLDANNFHYEITAREITG